MKRSLILLALAGVTSVALAQTPTPQLAHGWQQLGVLHQFSEREHRFGHFAAEVFHRKTAKFFGLRIAVGHTA